MRALSGEAGVASVARTRTGHDVLKYNLAIGGSCIVNPSGLWVREPMFNTEVIGVTHALLSP